MSFRGTFSRYRKLRTRKLVLSGTEVSATAAQLNRSNVRMCYVPVAAVVTGSMPNTVSIMAAPAPVTVTAAAFVPNEAFSQAAESFDFEIINAGLLGTGTNVIAKYAGTATDLVANKMLNLGTITHASVSAGASVVYKVSQQGTSGADSVAGVVVLEVKE